MKKLINISVVMAYLAGVVLLLCACSDNLDVKQQYAFSVETMPIPTQIAKGQTVEIRCLLKENGNFLDNQYTIRYFQFEGKGALRLGTNGKAFLPNDRYILPYKEFRLYYTSLCEESQALTVYFENSFGECKEVKLEFRAVKKE